MVTILGIESTAHTFGVAVVRDKQILSNEKDSYTTEDGQGGMIPIEVRKHHEVVAPKIYQQALKAAGIEEGEIDAIALSNAPGLAPCLLAGMTFAKELSTRLERPIVPVNHCVAHLEIGDTVGARDPVMLYASGANTQIIAYAPYDGVPPDNGLRGKAGKYRVFGETLDLGSGNFIDTFARFAGLGFPGGPKIQKLAEGSKNKEELIPLPYSIKGMDVSFSGIQTKLKTLLDKGEDLGRLSYSMQETVFAMLVEAAERALAHTGKKELVLGGGVACNSRLQEMCKTMCAERGVKYFCPAIPLLVDNAAMIAYLGQKMFESGISVDHKHLDRVDIDPRERTDQVEVGWR